MEFLQSENKNPEKTTLEEVLGGTSESSFGSEIYLRTIVDSCLDGITVLDEQGTFEFGNDSFFRIIGWPKEEIIGFHPKKIIPEDEYDLIVNRWCDVQEDIPYYFETKIKTMNGELKYVQVAHTLTTIKGEKKFVSVVRDITEFKKLEASLKESESKFRELFENADQPMYTHDLEGRFLSINKVGVRILGAPEEEIIGSNISKWLTPESYGLFKERVKKIHAGQPLEEPVIIEVICKNGEHRWGEIRTRLIKNNDKIIVHGIARDITENMLLKKELSRSNKHRKLLFHLIEGTRGGKTRALILKYLSNRSYNAHHIAKALDMDYKTIRHHLNVLIRNGVVIKTNVDGIALYSLSYNMELDLDVNSSKKFIK